MYFSLKRIYFFNYDYVVGVRSGDYVPIESKVRFLEELQAFVTVEPAHVQMVHIMHCIILHFPQ